MLDSLCWKILAFLSFQTSQITSMVSVRTAFRGVAGVVVMLVHHSKVLLFGFQLEGRKPGSATLLGPKFFWCIMPTDYGVQL